MADYFCDHGAYGTGSGVLGATPTWGVPQEGDGTSTAASTSASTAAILLNGQPSASQIVAICGVNFTAVASGATGNQFNIGASLDVTAQNLANAINASTTSVSSSIATGTPQLRNLVFARGPSSSPAAPSATCQLMMRVGSANLNSNVNNQITSTFGTAPTITQWNGGVGGCFGYFVNDIGIGVSGNYTAGAYGVLGASLINVGGATAAMTSADNIYVRTGNNKTIAITASSSFSITYSRNAKLLFDTNTKWTGDSANGLLSLNIAQGTNAVSLAVISVSFPSFYSSCLRRGNFKITSGVSGSTAVSISVFGVGGGNSYIDGWSFADANTGSIKTIDLAPTATLSSPVLVQYVNCDYERTVSLATIPALMTIMPSNTIGRVFFEGCKFTYNISGTSDPGALFNFASATTGFVNQVNFKNCQFVANGYSGGLTVFPSGTPTWVNVTTTVYEIRFENCIGLRYPTAFGGLVSATTFNDQDMHNLYMNLGTTGFRFENVRGLVDWNPLDNPPNLGTTLPDGTTVWSLRALWLANGALNTLTPFSVPAFRIFNRLSTAQRTIGVEFVAPTALTFTDQMVRIKVSYIDSTGTPRMESTQTIASSASSWNNASGYSAQKIVLTTAYSVMANTEIAVQMDLMGAPSSGSNSYLYICPEPSLS